MAVCITGMHRSGTSMVSKMLRLAGLYLGPDAELLPPTPSNADGFFENVKVLAVNDGLLDELGGGWAFPPVAPHGWEQGDALLGLKAEAEIVLRELRVKVPWGWKDPRNSLTLPFWQALLPELSVVHCIRNPLEVALSLGRRNYFAVSHSLHLWQAYNRSVLQHTSPEQRLVTHHDAYFHDAAAEIRRVLHFIGVAESDEVVEQCLTALTGSLRHWRLTAHHLLEAGVSREVSDLYAQLCEESHWIDAGTSGGIRLDRGTSALQLLTRRPESGSVDSSADKGIGRRLARICEEQCLRQKLSARDNEIRDLRKTAEEEATRRRQFDQELSQRDSELTALRTATAEVQSAVEAQLQAVAAKVDAFSARQEQISASLAALVQSFQPALEAQLQAVEAKVDAFSARQEQISASLGTLLQSVESNKSPKLGPMSRWASRLWRRIAWKSARSKHHKHLDTDQDEVGAAHQLVCSSVLRVDYPQLVSEIRQAVACHVPVGATLIVVSKGDDELLRLGDYIAWHFPRDANGAYAGYHPADSLAAAQELEALRANGGRYLLFPCTSFWWLEHYAGFRQHLDDRHQRLYADDNCVIYDLTQRSWLTRQLNWLWQLPRGRIAWSKSTPVNGSCETQVTSLPRPGGCLRVVLDYPQTLPLKPPPGPFDARHMDLHWVLPDIEQGMGGPMAIFRLIRYLELFGHKNTVWIRGGTRHGDSERIRKFIRQKFVEIDASVNLLEGNLDQIRGDAVIATHCWTAYPVRAIQNVRERFYFVQDFEPSFFPMGAEYLLSEATYRFGFRSITSSKWLQKIMRTRYGVKAARFTYAYDAEVYKVEAGPARAMERVAFYARPKTERRAVELGLMALERVATAHPCLSVDFFGGFVGRLNVPYDYADHGLLDDKALADLYRSATVGIVFSSTNYSLIPHEMMACGLAVIELDGRSTRAEFPCNAVTLAPPTPDGIAQKICRLLGDPELRAQQAQHALAYVGQLSWEQSARQVEAALVNGVLAKTDRPHDSGVLPRPPKRDLPKVNARKPRSVPGPIVFAAQPEYYRSAYFDLTSTGRHFEFPLTSADRSVLQELPQFARDRGAKTCIIFRPEWLASFPETFRKLKSQGIKVIGYSSEPIPLDETSSHPDQLLRLKQLEKVLSIDYDLIIHFDVASLEFLKRVGFKRIIAHPLPVSRKLFFPEDRPREFDVIFLGKSTSHREEMLLPLKMRFSTIHVAHGLRDEEARILMNRSKLVLNIHNDKYPNFENRVVQALFCHRPVLSELLTGDLLLPDRDYIRVDSPQDLSAKVTDLLRGNGIPGFKSRTDHAAFAIEALLQRLKSLVS